MFVQETEQRENCLEGKEQSAQLILCSFSSHFVFCAGSNTNWVLKANIAPPRAMQASPPRSTPPPPLRDWMRLKTLHTGLHKKPTPERLHTAPALTPQGDLFSLAPDLCWNLLCLQYCHIPYRMVYIKHTIRYGMFRLPRRGYGTYNKAHLVRRRTEDPC